ncbi:MAG: hypothetical protein RSB57_02370 [Hungatella sp.]
MKRFLRLWAVAVMAGILVMGSNLVSYAADIQDVYLTFSGTQPQVGQSVGEITVQSSQNDLYFVRYTGYRNDSSYWEEGEVPRVRIELYTQGGNLFNCNGKDHFSLSGMGAKYLSARILDGGTAMELTVTLSRIESALEAPSDLYWEGHHAEWDEIQNADQYEVSLYRNDNHLTTVRTGNTSYNFRNHMERSGDYYFRVRSIDRDGNRKGAWSEYSDETYVDRNDYESSSGSSYNDNHSPNCSVYTPYPTNEWRRDQVGWWYRHGDGSYVKNGWEQVKGIWYYFNDKGYMCTGWVFVKDKWYYLNADGAMLSNTRTPDGYYVDASGAWIQNTGQTSNQISNRTLEEMYKGPGYHR